MILLLKDQTAKALLVPLLVAAVVEPVQIAAAALQYKAEEPEQNQVHKQFAELVPEQKLVVQMPVQLVAEVRVAVLPELALVTG